MTLTPPLALSRRSLLKGATASALALPLLGLHGRRAEALTRLEPIASPYGPVASVVDQTTGLPLLQLPQGFTYQSFGWSGDAMADGRPGPTNHDGMAVVRSRLVGGREELTLIRNHEATVNPLYGTIAAQGFYDRGEALVGEDSDDNEVTGPAAGGTTRLLFVDGRFTEAAPSLGGTWNNCAGGAMPWGTWLSGEEDKADLTEVGGQPHGYVFEVSPETGETTGEPIKAMGRFDHEAAAFDPVSGALYLTEDDRNQAGLYKFVPSDASAPGLAGPGGHALHGQGGRRGPGRPPRPAHGPDPQARMGRDRRPRPRAPTLHRGPLRRREHRLRAVRPGPRPGRAQDVAA